VGSGVAVGSTVGSGTVVTAGSVITGVLSLADKSSARVFNINSGEMPDSNWMKIREATINFELE